jgi:hypothetical protein
MIGKCSNRPQVVHKRAFAFLSQCIKAVGVNKIREPLDRYGPIHEVEFPCDIDLF